MAAHPDHRAAHKIAVRKTKVFYPASEYETESMARVAQAYPEYQHKDDKLLADTYHIFAAYGEAKANGDKGIIKRINRSTRLRLNGYSDFVAAQKAHCDFMIYSNHSQGIPDGILYDSSCKPPVCSKEDLEAAKAKFENSCKKLSSGGYVFDGNGDVFYVWQKTDFQNA